MRRISLALALVSAVAAVGCAGGNTSSGTDSGSAKGVYGQSFVVTVVKPTGGNILSVPAGIDCGTGDKCSVSFPWSSSVELTATANAVVAPATNVFLGWAADCAGTGVKCVLKAGLDKTAVAVFGPTGTSHPMFMDPAIHGPAYFDFVAKGTSATLVCTTCHGASLQGLGIAPACNGCHAMPPTLASLSNTFHFNANFGGLHNGADCARCHTSDGFRDFIGVDGTSELASAPKPTLDTTTGTKGPLQCDTCHNAVSDPSAGTLRTHKFPSGLTVTTDPATAICSQCHDGARPGYEVSALQAVLAANPTVTDDQQLPTASNKVVRAHYLPAASTLFGAKAANWFQYTGKLYSSQNLHGGQGSCVSCHDAHTGSLPADAEMAAKCGACHFTEAGAAVKTFLELEEARQFGFEGDINGNGNTAESLRAEIDGLGTTLYAAIRAYATNVALADICIGGNKAWLDNGTGTDGVASDGVCQSGEMPTSGNTYNAFTPRLLKAVYNYLLYQNDTGGWAHNPRYEIEVLYDTITDLNAGLPAANKVAFAGLRTFAGHFGAADAQNPAGGMAFRDWDPGPVPNNCSQCHAGATGLANYLVDQNTPITNPPVMGMECTTCHQPHPYDTRFTTMRSVATLNFPPRKAAAKQVSFPAASLFPKAGDQLCATCHSGRENGTSIDDKIAAQNPQDAKAWNISFTNPHYLGAAGMMLGSDAKMMYQYPGKTYATKPVFWNAPYGSPHGQSCSSCHAAQFSRHTFEIDLATTVPGGLYKGAVNTKSCKACHDAHVPNGLETVRTEFEERSLELYNALRAYSKNAANFKDGVAVPVCYSAAAYPYWFKDNGLNGGIAGNGICEAGELDDDTDPSNTNLQQAKFNPTASKAAFNYKWTQAEPGAWAHNEVYVFQVIFDTISDLGATPSFTRP